MFATEPAKPLWGTHSEVMCHNWQIRRFFPNTATSPFFFFFCETYHTHLSILPAIGLHGPLAISVRADTYTAKKYKHFLKYDLVCDC
ncbi:hypothetical protein VP01_1383g10 [Puccinia sorghi]|uniref:Uncharacterized protein n=1 Tax=Puccinia sorghi TaxID=27349 RepID=A0A0L6VLX9_9BASI|nr:hypothetical protein VP01_1383g10 [Puccinia sorghi]